MIFNIYLKNPILLLSPEFI